VVKEAKAMVVQAQQVQLTLVMVALPQEAVELAAMAVLE
jgi:hypothetical protein